MSMSRYPVVDPVSKPCWQQTPDWQKAPWPTQVARSPQRRRRADEYGFPRDRSGAGSTQTIESTPCSCGCLRRISDPSVPSSVANRRVCCRSCRSMNATLAAQNPHVPSYNSSGASPYARSPGRAPADQCSGLHQLYSPVVRPPFGSLVVPRRLGVSVALGSRADGLHQCHSLWPAPLSRLQPAPGSASGWRLPYPRYRYGPGSRP